MRVTVTVGNMEIAMDVTNGDGQAALDLIRALQGDSRKKQVQESRSVSMKAAAEVYKALGIPDRIGFTQAAASAHCSFPSSQSADVTAFIDTDLFTQAFTNLIRNAAEYGSGEGLEIRVAELGTDRVQIALASNGTPVAGNEFPRVSRRVHSGAGRDSGGFGLGISIAVQSIEAIGGELKLDEAVDGGVTARIEVPSGRLSSS